MQDLTGAVRILCHPGKNSRWSIGTGACADVHKGKCIRAEVIDDTRVSGSASTCVNSYLCVQALVAVKLLRVAADESPAEMEARNRVSLLHVDVTNSFGPCIVL